MKDVIEIVSRDYWVKIIEMLQQNWALIDIADDGSAHVYFVTDTGGVFDELEFPSTDEAGAALRRNGFRRYSTDPRLKDLLHPPEPPFWRGSHPNGPIYSSGRFWRSE